MREMRAARDAADADLVELRLDTVDRPDVAAALDGRRRPVIVTCRAPWEGGGFRGSEEERRRILEAALAAGAEYVDVEARAGFAPDLIRGARVDAASSFRDTISRPPPTDVEALYRACCATGRGDRQAGGRGRHV